MRKVNLWLMLGLMFIAGFAKALDPVAPRSSRGQGRIVVDTPRPDNSVSISSLKASGPNFTPKAGETIEVPVGNYRVAVKMQNYSYAQDVRVDSTETSFIVVPGYGNLKVNSVHPEDPVTVTDIATGQMVANFPASEVKILPRGYYRVQVAVPGSFPAIQDNIWVVTNTTRVLDISKP